VVLKSDKPFGDVVRSPLTVGTYNQAQSWL